MALKNEQEETITLRKEKGFLVIMSMKKKRKNHRELVDRVRIPFLISFFSFFMIEFIFFF